MVLLRSIANLPRRRKLLLFGAIIFLSSGVFAYSWLFFDLPSIDRLQAGLALPSTRIYDRNGRIDSAFFIDHGIAMEAGGDALVLGRVRQHIARQLIDREVTE